MSKIKSALNILKPLLIVLVMVFSLTFNYQSLPNVFAEPNCDNPSTGELDHCIDKITNEINALKPAHEANKKELENLKNSIFSLSKQISAISSQLDELEDDINEREEDLAYTTEILFEKIRADYIRRRLHDVISSFLSEEDVAKAIKEVFFLQMVANDDRETIENLAEDIVNLREDKNSLEKNRNNLASAKSKLDGQADFLGGEVAKVESYIASLSAKQQQFIAQKLGSLNLPTTLGSGALVCVDDRDPKYTPGFSPAFAFYSFGIPHYVGMNQYGAYGRASFGGQDYKTILQAYYNNVSIECRDLPSQIAVDGYGSKAFDDYVKGVVNKEMGASIPEALKAQAVAARSYAISVTNNGQNSICTTQYCQVYSDARRQEASDAVDATGKNICGAGRAEVLVSGGQVITAWYASTFGGYAHRSSPQLPNADQTSYTKNFADAQGPIGSFSDLFQKAYDRESKCFYAAKGWRKESPYNNSAWLKAEEVADIANVILAAKAGVDTNHLYQIDKSNPEGVETYSMEKVKQELRNRNVTPIDSASSVSVTGVDFGTGRTTQVTINGVSFSGDEFKGFFNLRAPANIQIVGPLFNVERK